MATFDAATLRELDQLKEVGIRTEKHPTSLVTIWIVVDDGTVFIRSVKGPTGRWFKDLEHGGPATLEFGGRVVPVTAVPVADAGSLDRASRQYLSKYQGSPYAAPMVRAEVLPTTLRLEPR